MSVSQVSHLQSCLTLFSFFVSLPQPDHPNSDKLVAFYYDMTKSMSIIANFSYDLRLMEIENSAAANGHVKYGGEVGETSPQGVVGHIYEEVSV